MPYKLSPSSLNLLKDCKRCFWLHHNKSIKRPSSVFPSLPSGMDKVLKEHFDLFMDKDELPPELREFNGKLKLFNNKELLSVWRNNRKGIQWKDNRENILSGAIDNLLEKNNKLIVLDYKTRGFPLKEDTHEHYQDQLDIYNFLLRKNDYETEDFAFLLFYHPNKVHENGDVDFKVDIIRLRINVKNAESLFYNALKVLEKDIPESSDKCSFCEWARKFY